MIDSFTAFTNEVDDVKAAVDELLQQLDLGSKNILKKNTIGIVSCYAEYIESGLWKTLCDKLPFEVAGASTNQNMIAGEIGETMFALLVLTSDDVTFSTAYSEPVAEETDAPLRALYQTAAEKLLGKPSLMLSFAPLLTSFGSDYYVEQMSEISENVPNFGTLAVDHNDDYHDSVVMLNGESWPDRYAIILIHGPIEPVFYIGSISEERVFAEKGVVTASAGNQLQTVNGIPAIDYLQSLGLSKNEDGSITGINSFPIVVDYNDGTMPVVRAMFAVTPDGHVVCGGNIPVGSTLSIGSFDSDEILTTTCRTLEKASHIGKNKIVLAYSCIGRFFAQGYDPLAEFLKINEYLDSEGITYMAAYSGGELCPVYDKEGGTYNRNHNNTFIVCAF